MEATLESKGTDLQRLSKAFPSFHIWRRDEMSGLGGKKTGSNPASVIPFSGKNITETT